jgi:hypothetical protein
VLYPQVSERIMSALRCRKLGDSLAVLEADYAVDCDSDEYCRVRVLSQVLVLIWPLGIPVGLAWLLRREWSTSQKLWQQTIPASRSDNSEVAASTSSDELVELVDDDATLISFHAKRIERTFGFCTAPYRHECWWFEPVDMLRKLALSGLLQFVHRGSAEQVLVGCSLAFCSFGLQQYWQPYLEPEANVLKGLVDGQIFLTFLISFILRVLPRMASFESIGTVTYGYILVYSLALVLVSAVGLLARQVRRRRRFQTGLVGSAMEPFALGPLGENPLSLAGWVAAAEATE